MSKESVTAQPKKVRLAIFGSSWWVDSMYLPALKDHPFVEVVAICGRDLERARARATQWGIAHAFNKAEDVFALDLDAVIVATDNASHYPLSMQALEQGLHVLCEKPLTEDAALAQAMNDKAIEKGLVNMTPFTYSFMPSVRYLKDLIDDGYLGKPYHFGMRYYAGYGLDDGYSWRFDSSISPTGILGDLSSHFLYIATWIFGEVEGLYCHLNYLAPHALANPQGESFAKSNDSVMLTLSFKSGVQGMIHASSVAYEGTAFNQRHLMEFHGSKGTLYHENDWDAFDVVKGAQVGQGAVRALPRPEHYHKGLRLDSVHNSYKDVFRKQDVMARAFINAIVEGETQVRPSFAEGAYVQKLVEKAMQSHEEKRWVNVD